jgi:hypothetical protein
MVTYLGWLERAESDCLLLQLRRMRLLVFHALVTSRVARSDSFDGNGECAQELQQEAFIGCG